METKGLLQKDCLHCGQVITIESRFCKHCGTVQVPADEINKAGQHWSYIQQLALFYALDFLICCLAKFVDGFKTLAWSFVFDTLFAGVALLFFAYNWAINRQLLIWRNFSLQKVAMYGGIAMIGSLLVHYSVGWLNHTIYSEDDYFFPIFQSSRFAKAIMIFSIAVLPALFEELAYRGYLLQALLQVADARQAVFVSSFLFAILHLSFISLFWLIPFALFIGHVRIKENTIWYGVIFHFCFNLTACLMELL